MIRSYPNLLAQLQRLARKLKFACSKFRYDTFQKVNNKGADHTGYDGFSCIEADMIFIYHTVSYLGM